MNKKNAILMLFMLFSCSVVMTTASVADPLYAKAASDETGDKVAVDTKTEGIKASEKNESSRVTSDLKITDSVIADKTSKGEADEGLADESLPAKARQTREQHFKNIDELVVLRAPGLAYSYLQREQPDYNRQNPLQWLYWEQKRIALLQYMRKWSLINQRVLEQKEHLASFKVATADRNWFLNARLKALLELKQYDRVLSETRQLLWNASSLVNTDTLATWRRIIIQVYLNQGKVNDTQIAMRRYQQDYGELKNEDGVTWLQLQAQLLIQLEHYDEAIVKLEKIRTSESQALILLAKLKAESIAPSDVLDSVQLELVSIKDDVERKSLFQYVALVASVAANDTEQAIFLLESLLSDRDINLSGSVIQTGGVKIDADTLWDFYLETGNNAANNKGLLRGDDVSWYTLASNVYLSEPIIAKSLFAVLSLKSKALKHREQSMMQLVSLIESNDQPLQLVNRLFTESGYIQSLSIVPAKVRYLLVDYSLSRGDVKNAADLMADLNQPPKGQPKFNWNLRRARVLILSGSFNQGADVLREMLRPETLQPEALQPEILRKEPLQQQKTADTEDASAQKTAQSSESESTATEADTPAGGISADQVDKYLQVVFDLQAVGQYQLSLNLFNQLQNVLDDVRLHRELTFWKAESYHALEQYSLAAYLFLKSAVSPDNVYDPWYHTATFRAAESLMQAGLYEDARQRFLHLLSITDNVARKSVIRQRLQKIQLKEQIK